MCVHHCHPVGRHSSRRNEAMTVEYLKLLSEAISADTLEIFTDDVTDDVAPGYLSVILLPMSFTSVRASI